MNDCLSIYSGQIYSFTNVTQSVTFYATRYFLKTFNVFRCISSSQLSWNTLHLFHLFSSLHVRLLLDPFNNLVNSLKPYNSLLVEWIELLLYKNIISLYLRVIFHLSSFSAALKFECDFPSDGTCPWVLITRQPGISGYIPNTAVMVYPQTPRDRFCFAFQKFYCIFSDIYFASIHFVLLPTCSHIQMIC